MTKTFLTTCLLLTLNSLYAQTVKGVRFENFAVKVSNAKKAKIEYASHPYPSVFLVFMEKKAA